MLIKAPQVKVFVKPYKQYGDYVVLACFVIAKHENGFVEILKTFYKTVSRTEYEQNREKYSETFKVPIILALAGNIYRQCYEIVRSTFNKISVLPYIDFSFFVSQPTRAPSKF